MDCQDRVTAGGSSGVEFAMPGGDWTDINLTRQEKAINEFVYEHFKNGLALEESTDVLHKPSWDNLGRQDCWVPNLNETQQAERNALVLRILDKIKANHYLHEMTAEEWELVPEPNDEAVGAPLANAYIPPPKTELHFAAEAAWAHDNSINNRADSGSIWGDSTATATDSFENASSPRSGSTWEVSTTMTAWEDDDATGMFIRHDWDAAEGQEAVNEKPHVTLDYNPCEVSGDDDDDFIVVSNKKPTRKPTTRQNQQTRTSVARSNVPRNTPSNASWSFAPIAAPQPKAPQNIDDVDSFSQAAFGTRSANSIDDVDAFSRAAFGGNNNFGTKYSGSGQKANNGGKKNKRESVWGPKPGPNPNRKMQIPIYMRK
ncbi:hypothetical protein B0T16DRAFT_242499 [Cercophora newfieldiana]|uniref:Uncharacterized protein n=1 Tax=Cercophora newfieldiana TaxID=92897 RepID=A0AA40CJ22_9PEZI|nr:hypothetical protein B0T16DRAFT_242499 [Cercophora newfieldiana]